MTASTTEQATASAVSGPRPYTPGVAPIKAEYLIATSHLKSRPDDDAAESHTGPVKRAASSEAERPAHIDGRPSTNGEADGDGEGPKKLKGAARKKAKQAENRAKQMEKRQGGSQNKIRKFMAANDEVGVCHAIAEGKTCERGDACKYSHSITDYLKAKSHDIYLPVPPLPEASHLPLSYGSLWKLSESDKTAFLDGYYSVEEPFVTWAPKSGDLDQPVASSSQVEASPSAETTIEHSFNSNTTCPTYHSLQSRPLWDASASKVAPRCPYGFKCRMLGAHVKALPTVTEGEASGYLGSGLELPWEDSSEETWRGAFDETNYTDPGLSKTLRTKKYPLPRTKAVTTLLAEEERAYQKDPVDPKGPLLIDLQAIDKAAAAVPSAPVDEEDLDAMANARAEEAAQSQSRSDVDLARIRRSEKRRLDWHHGELYLAPLTTTGNLPFRRICATFGSDIHCGEMGLAGSYLEGNKSEWSLVRRWEGEKTFGIQLCGSKPELLVPTAEVMAKEFGPSGGLDFVDINCGCPIDLVFNHGGGSALLDHPRKLGRIVRGMDAVLGDIPVTVKLRTGVTSKNTSHHRIMPKVQNEWGAGAVTMHGRSRKQRYARRADWDYIRLCGKELRESVRQWNEESKTADEEEMAPIPFYGNGDVYSQQEYYANLDNTGVDGEMIARGALIKPWIFTEIKERRDWDISSRERLDIIRQFAHYGLQHWGSDTQGVNKTRKFMCEAMSFFHRYVPLGLLEHLPPSMNDRPPLYRGRDELETLLSSDDAGDWVKISEMFLGKAENFTFEAKHKSNSYTDSTEQQG